MSDSEDGSFSGDVSSDDLSEDSDFDSDVSSSESDENDVWTRVYPPEPERTPIAFTARNPGPRNMPPQNSSPLTYFLLFLTKDILRTIVNQTKTYAENCLQTNQKSSRFQKWRRLAFDVSMLQKFLGLVISMGLVVKRDLTMYWDTKFPLISTPFFSSVMSRNTFQLISSFLHCSDNNSPQASRTSSSYDPLHEFRLILDALNTACKKHYIPRQLISIDESLIGMKNRTELIQYIPNKHHHKWGIKLYSVTESATGYPMHTNVYCGKRREEPASEYGHSYDVVQQLITKSGLANKGYHLFVDNFYTSAFLAQKMFEQGVMLTGTLRANRKGIPIMIKEARPKVQECVYARNGHTLMLSWKEKPSQKKPCIMLSTGISAGMVEHQLRGGHTTKRKPKIVSEYNKHMGGVDLLDQKVDYYAGERAFHKYWKKCFFALIDRMIVCAYILYQGNTSDTPPMSRYKFMCTLVEELCGRPERATLPQEPSQHRLEQLDGKKEKDCVVCSDRATPGGRKRARTQCQSCCVGVHMKCFVFLDHSTKRKK